MWKIRYKLPRKHHADPTLAIFDTKSAYETINRNFTWDEIKPHLPSHLLHVLCNLVNDIRIEALPKNVTSAGFLTTTGVLEDSILSLSCFVYINELFDIPRLWFLENASLEIIILSATQFPCLIHADDIILIFASSSTQDLLVKCEDQGFCLACR
ncbi:hypothetical protein BD560DRAFT_437297 [Blakeslea trispora]|nr:hypothetical protein BD560DRAFT_437297 [Blakeslea trispora]